MQVFRSSTLTPADRRNHVSCRPQFCSHRICKLIARSTNSEQDAASTSQPQYTSVPFSELPKPNPAANKALLKAKGMGNQVGRQMRQHANMHASGRTACCQALSMHEACIQAHACCQLDAPTDWHVQGSGGFTWQRRLHSCRR